MAIPDPKKTGKEFLKQLDLNLSKSQKVAEDIQPDMLKIGNATIPFIFNVNEWGSCQYSSAYATYKFIMHQFEEKCLSCRLQLLNISFHYEKKREFDEIRSILINSMVDEIEMNRNNEIGLRRYSRMLSKFIDAENGTDILQIFKEASYDLWGAIEYLIGVRYFRLQVKGLSPSPGYGPICNIKAQSQGTFTGLCCAVLVLDGFIEDPSVFSGFDT